MLSIKGLDKQTILFPVLRRVCIRCCIWVRLTVIIQHIQYLTQIVTISSFFFQNSLFFHTIRKHNQQLESLFLHADPDFLFNLDQNSAAASDRRPELKMAQKCRKVWVRCSCAAVKNSTSAANTTDVHAEVKTCQMKYSLPTWLGLHGSTSRLGFLLFTAMAGGGWGSLCR